ncbi:hypothetical protein [Glutamicibacter ardleyensis]|uniref:hypothetical protein n=1 Tax=Glutamicibacter ardleyensis TaxID=225894 RepID=UPI0036D2925A
MPPSERKLPSRPVHFIPLVQVHFDATNHQDAASCGSAWFLAITKHRKFMRLAGGIIRSIELPKKIAKT